MYLPNELERLVLDGKDLLKNQCFGKMPYVVWLYRKVKIA